MLYLFDTASRGLAPLVAMETTIRQQRYTSFCVCFFFFFCITPHQTTAFSAATAVTTWRVGVMLDACVCDGTWLVEKQPDGLKQKSEERRWGRVSGEGMSQSGNTCSPVDCVYSQTQRFYGQDGVERGTVSEGVGGELLQRCSGFGSALISATFTQGFLLPQVCKIMTCLIQGSHDPILWITTGPILVRIKFRIEHKKNL